MSWSFWRARISRRSGWRCSRGGRNDPAIDAIVARYRSLRLTGERFLDTYRRIGIEPFREAVYGSSPERTRAVA